MQKEKVEKIFGNQLRVRVGGLLRINDEILLINHSGLNDENEFWLPPGGGVQFGETVKEALKREFFEETGLVISIVDFLIGYEFISNPFHAIELFFEVRHISGELLLGSDPEVAGESFLQEVKYMSISQLRLISAVNKHRLISEIDTIEDLFEQKGNFIFI